MLTSFHDNKYQIGYPLISYGTVVSEYAILPVTRRKSTLLTKEVETGNVLSFYIV